MSLFRGISLGPLVLALLFGIICGALIFFSVSLMYGDTEFVYQGF